MSGADIAIVVLLEDESPDFARYIEALYSLFRQRGTSFEFVIIANGTERFAKSQLALLPDTLDNIQAFSFPKRVCQAVCVRTVLKETQSDILVMCGSYQQITLAAFNDLLDALIDDVDLVCPWRLKRVDPAFNQFQSRIFNSLLAFITGSALHDLSCNTRIFHREVLEEVPMYGNQYRFLPLLAQQKGYRVQEVPCAHFQERGKIGFYSFSEYMGRILDIGTLYFNTRFSRMPLRFFSAIGTGLMALGFITALWVFILKLMLNASIGDSPALLTAIILMVAGVQTAGLGLLGEIIAFTRGRQRKEYTIEKIISSG